MGKDFNRILDKCLSQIKAGRVDIDSCLAQHPEYADQLRPLLETAILLWQKPQPQARSEAISRGEQLLSERVLGKRPGKALRKESVKTMNDKIGIGGGPRRRSSFLPPRWRPQWVAVVASVLALFIFSGGIVAASNDSMPGEILYPAKIAAENARLALTPSEEGRARLHIAFAERRMDEIAEMSKRGQTKQVVKLTPALAQHLEEAGQVISDAGESQVTQELKTSLEESADQQLAILEEAFQQSTEDTKPLIAQALEASAESYGLALEAALIGATSPSLLGKVGTIQILVTDPPPPEDIDSVIVEVASIEVHLAGGPDSGWITIIDEPKSFDLMELIGGKEVDLGSTEVNAGTYTQVRMEITQATVIAGGEEHDAAIPSGRLKFVRPFQVEEDGTTSLILDFDGQRSINVTGQGRYMLKPVVTLLVSKQASAPDEIEDEEAEGLEFEGIIEAIDGTTWTMTVDGETLTIDVSGAEIEGEPAVGLEAEVEGAVVDDTIVASKVEIREAEEGE